MSNKGIRLNNVVRLHRADQRRLEDLVQEQYVTSGMTDVAFAMQAAEQLKLPGINQNHVAGAREVFGIKSNRDVLRNAVKSDGTLVQRVSKLERELSALRAAFDVFKHGCRGDKS
jgi:hypothetical protein